MALLDELVVFDASHPETTDVVREVHESRTGRRGRRLVHRQVAEAGGEVDVVRLRDRVRVELDELASVVAEQVHITPPVEDRLDR